MPVEVNESSKDLRLRHERTTPIWVEKEVQSHFEIKSSLRKDYKTSDPMSGVRYDGTVGLEGERVVGTCPNKLQPQARSGDTVPPYDTGRRPVNRVTNRVSSRFVNKFLIYINSPNCTFTTREREGPNYPYVLEKSKRTKDNLS